ncbi:AfsR/SARP family transcriptional regulator [Streptomyces sp. BE303]|uniref:AfsR/SARP family transcriptional regulator n=1 Tax=Streptomyces sp. BE303 TaxID=3002528 RepID=UPI002E76DFC0|nr:transcriptional regulator [Streptomyces sp. BE303]MED7955006.1 transcriptional regulator [Streptomyces sp. BE303]
MFVRLLGPVELQAADGRAVEPAGAKRRAALALLALELGRTVPVERFFELLWGDEPPARARAALQGHIAALRKLLAGSKLVLSTRAPGYRLDGPAESVDALLFERLVARATEVAVPDGDESAAGLLRRALDLWHGPATLADLPETDLRDVLADRLRQVRTRALEAWSERLLRLGLGPDAAPELDRALEADPWNEPLAALLVLCLRQAGRPCDALTVYHRTRRRLAAELGVGPGRALRSAVADILADEPGRRPPSTAVRVTGRPERTAGAAGTTGTTGRVRPRAAGSAGLSACAVPPARQPAAVPFPARTPAVRPPTPLRPTANPGPTANPNPGPGPGPGPDQLPRRISGFVGRSTERRWLEAECGGERPGGGLAVLVGPAGTGKTAAAVQWAHDATAAFPDGRLFADLNGFGPGPRAEPTAVLGRFLRALGVPEGSLPEDPAARAALYRSLTHGRRLLVVLDNVRDAQDVTELLPTGPACATVVTSRSSLEDLVVTEGAALLRLGALPAEDARRLLERLIGPARVAAEPEAAGRLAELCDRLPLALRIAGARLAARPGWAIADLLPELADESTRLRALDTRGTASVRTALDLTLRHLPASAARLLALLAVHPGPETDAHAAAALLRTGAAEARLALGALAAHHLLTETAPGRYGRHDLVRLYGAELLDERPASERAAATAALTDHYLAVVARSSALLQPGPAHATHRPAPAVAPPFGADPAGWPHLPTVPATLDWFQAAEPTVRGLVTAASERGDHRRSWQLAYRADCLYYGAGRRTDRLTCLRVGLAAAARTGDPAAVASMEAVTARALGGSGRTAEAHRLARRAVDRTVGSGDTVRVQALTVLATATAADGRPAEAVRLGEQAIALAERHGLAEHAPYALSNTAGLYGLAGEPGRALHRARDARALLADHPLAVFHLSAMINEAHALQLLDRRTAAEEVWQQTLERCRVAGTVHLHAVAERHYADFLLAGGRAPEAVRTLHSARRLYGRLGDTTVVHELEVRLAALEPV